ncbi:MAG: tetratricopeptide repeat protein, partial [Proteobacteria bacterium]|nr:tetratricopeptide repeat protein [Pseudomonadota bacterium]
SEAAASEAAASEAAASEAAAAEAAAEAAAAEAAAAEAAASEAAAAEAAASEAAAAEAAAADEAARAAEIEAERAAQPRGLTSGPTIVAEPEEWAAMVSEDEESVADEESDVVASADDFLDPPSDAVAGFDPFADPDAATEQALRTEDTGPALQESSTDVEAPEAQVRYEPSAAEADTWRGLIDTLCAEAAVASTGGAELLAEAARIARTRLSDFTLAEEIARSAVTADAATLAGHRELEKALNRNQKFGELRAVMERLAELEGEDIAAAEILQDTALLARRHLSSDDDALKLLKASVERNPEDFFSLQLLRDVQLASRDWRGIVLTLEKMAALGGGCTAARLHYERGRVYSEQLSDNARALTAFRSGYSSDPGHVPSFVAVERLYTLTAEWTPLVELYLAEAERTEGTDAAFFISRAARIYRSRLFDEDRALETYEKAVEAGAGPELHHEFQAFLAEAGKTDRLIEALRTEADVVSDEEKPYVLYRIARLCETNGDAEGALAAYREVSADPSAVPAAEAVARLLQATGDSAGLLAFWKERIEVVDDPNLQVTLAYRMGEICEGSLSDQEGARQAFERVLDIAPGYLPALEGLERVYTRLEDWEKLAAVYEQRAILNEEPAAVALQLHRAGAVCEFRMEDGVRARDFYRRALDHVSDFPPSLDAMLRILEADGDWLALANTLRAAANASQDGSQQVSFLYRAGRIYSDQAGDDAAAIECLDRCLELSPGFLSAHYLLKELKGRTGDWRGVFDLQHGEASAEAELDRKAWQLISAAEIAGGLPEVDASSVVLEVLEADPAHAGARALLEQLHHRTGNLGGLVGIYRNAAGAAESDDDRARLSAVLADVLRDLGDSMGAVQAAGEVISASDAAERPLVGVARLCEGLNYWEEALRALDAAGERFDAARIYEDYLDGGAEAIAGYEAVLADEPENISAAAGIARLQRKSGDRMKLAEAHALVAELVEQVPVKVVHAVLAGHLFEGLERPDDALAAYRVAFDARPSSGKAFEGIRRILLAQGDLEGVTAVYAGLPVGDALGLASALEESGDHAGAAAALESGEDLVSLLRRERALEAAEDWQGAFGALRARTALMADESQKGAAEAKQRWMLAEKLSETDEAWDLYRQLHEERPYDPEVLEALARIAGARGEVDLGLQYLGQLAEQATEPADAARLQRRIGEIQEKNENPDEAKAAYLAALDHEPEDREALNGLRRVAEGAEDWQGLVGVLAREASLIEGTEQADRYAEIARIWQDKLEDGAVAADSWRKVLDLDPGHREALERLVALNEGSGDWASYVEHADRLSQHLEGAEKSALQRQIGLAWRDQLRSEDDALRWFDTATAGDTPDLEAAVALEQARSLRGEWEQVVTALRRQARAQEGEGAVDALLRAARIKLDTLQNRADAAAIFTEILELDPEHDEALRFVADHRFRAGDKEGAVELFERIEARSESWDLDDFDEKVEIAQFYYQYGTTLIVMGRSDEAKEKLGRALELNPSHLPTLRAVGPLHMADENWKAAEGVWRQVLQLIGGSADKDELCNAYAALGEVERALGKTDKARKRFNKALEMRPNDVRALLGVAGVLFDRSEWSNLLNVYNNVIFHAKDPSHVIRSYLTKGYVLDAKMGLADKATQHYQKTLAFDPAQDEALLRLAELAVRKEDWAEAASLSDRALALDVSDERKVMLLLVRAAAKQSVGDGESAAVDFQEASPPEDMGELDLSDVPAIAAALKTKLQADQG